MKTFRKFASVLLLAVVLAVSAMAGETQTPPAPDPEPGETQGPHLISESSTAPGNTQGPGFLADLLTILNLYI